MKKRNYLSLAITLMTLTSLTAQAEKVIFACPAPETIIFSQQQTHYLANAKMQRIWGLYRPLPIMEGQTMNAKVSSFINATHSSAGNGYFSCIYATGQSNHYLTLVNRPVPGLKYCHFYNIGPKPDVDSCTGTISKCEIECDTND